MCSSGRRPCSRSSASADSARAPRGGRSSIGRIAAAARVLVAHHADPIGHLVGVLSLARPRFRDRCFLYVADHGLARLVLSRRGYSAITFGHVIVAAGEPAHELWRHELRHVRQYERIGCAFLPLYVLWYRRRGYRRHPLEREAARATRLFDR